MEHKQIDLRRGSIDYALFEGNSDWSRTATVQLEEKTVCGLEWSGKLGLV